MTDPASPGQRLQQSNPWVATLISLGAIVVVIGLIVLIVGVSNVSGSGRDSGVGELYLGSSLLGLGALTMVSGFIVAGFDWSLRHATAGESAPPTSDEVQRGASDGAQ